MKKNLKMFITCGVLFAAMPLMAETEFANGYTWTYRINGDTAEIYNKTSKAVSPEPTGELIIPDTLGGKPVTFIGNGSFWNCTNITSVTIPTSVTNIGYWAFRNCGRLTDVTIPDSVTKIGYAAFKECSSLTNVMIGSGMTGEFVYVFEDCSSLMSISVDERNLAYKSVNGLLLTKDGTILVEGINGNVVIPDSVCDIRFHSFRGRKGLTSVSMSLYGVTNIQYGAFDNCVALTNAAIPNSVSRIGDYAFRDCNRLIDTNSVPGAALVNGWVVGHVGEFETVTDEYGYSYMQLDLTNVRGIADSVFDNLDGYQYPSQVVEVKFGSSIRRIGAYAFGLFGTYEFYVNLSGVHVGSIGEYAFKDCFVYSSDDFASADFGNVENIDDAAFAGCYGLADSDGFVVVKGVLHDYQGYNTSGYEHPELAIPEGVTRIGSYVFRDNNNHYSGPSVYDGSSIRHLTIPDSVTSIGQYAFDGLSLESLTIGAGVVAIEDNAFSNSGSSSIETIIVDERNPYYMVEGGILMSKDGSRIVYVMPKSFAAATGMCGAWTTGGDAEWSVNGGTSPYWQEPDFHGSIGECCITSGAINDGQSSWVEISVRNTGLVSFWWKASSEAYRDELFDFATFSVDGVEVAVIGGETDWTNVTHLVSGNGPHVLRWTYQKDSDGNDGADRVWLDEVQYAHKVCVSFSGGTDAEGTPPHTIIVDLGENVVLPGSASLVRAKHKFVGWRFGDSVFAPGTVFAPSVTDIVFSAEWEEKRAAKPDISVAERFSGDSTTVSMSCETPGASIHYTLDGTEPTVESALYTEPFSLTETTTIKAVAVLDDWFDSEIASTRSVRIPQTLGEGLNANLVFRTGGQLEWRQDLGVTHDGEASARSGDIGDGQASWIEMEVVGAGTVSFWCKVSSEASKKRPYDFLRFTVNGEQVDSVQDIGGEIGWTNIVYAVGSSGTNILRWTYIKDEKTSIGDDCAWLDEVTWAPVELPDPIPQVSSDDDVAAALVGTTDASLAANVTNVVQYVAYRDWVLAVTNATTTAQMIKESARTWLSYALGADALIEKELTSDDVKIESFIPASTDGKFEFTVSVKDVNIGGGSVTVETLKENLKKVLGVEGAASLSPGGFSSDNIDITFDTPVDGKARFTVTPPADAGSSFFMRVKVK